MIDGRRLARAGQLVIMLACAIALLPTACSTGSSGRPGGHRSLPPVAQPGNVVATDLAFAREAREAGQTSAFRRFAAADAVVHLTSGPVAANEWLADRQRDLGADNWPVDWTPSSVWSSCDGSLAVANGRTANADGLVGSYVTVWQRQRDGSYRWTYYLAALDDPQPPRRERQLVPEGEGVIVVPGLNAIEGKTADCTPGAAPPPAPALAPNTAHAVIIATDQTLRYRWEQQLGGQRQVVIDYLRDGQWQQALDFAVPVTGMAASASAERQ